MKWQISLWWLSFRSASIQSTNCGKSPTYIFCFFLDYQFHSYVTIQKKKRSVANSVTSRQVLSLFVLYSKMNIMAKIISQSNYSTIVLVSKTCGRNIQNGLWLTKWKDLLNYAGILEAEAADLLMFRVCELPCAVTLSPSASVSWCSICFSTKNLHSLPVLN